MAKSKPNLPRVKEDARQDNESNVEDVPVECSSSVLKRKVHHL
jgi:hypothetical protein